MNLVHGERVTARAASAYWRVEHGDEGYAIPRGCRFQPLCPSTIDCCQEIDPPFVEMTPQQQAACLLAEK